MFLAQAGATFMWREKSLSKHMPLLFGEKQSLSNHMRLSFRGKLSLSPSTCLLYLKRKYCFSLHAHASFIWRETDFVSLETHASFTWRENAPCPSTCHFYVERKISLQAHASFILFVSRCPTSPSEGIPMYGYVENVGKPKPNWKYEN